MGGVLSGAHFWALFCKLHVSLIGQASVQLGRLVFFVCILQQVVRLLACLLSVTVPAGLFVLTPLQQMQRPACGVQHPACATCV